MPERSIFTVQHSRPLDGWVVLARNTVVAVDVTRSLAAAWAKRVARVLQLRGVASVIRPRTKRGKWLTEITFDAPRRKGKPTARAARA